MIGINSIFTSSPINVPSNLEIVWASLTLKDKKIIIGACYRSPSADKSFVDNLHDVINLIYVRYPHSPVILFGDFNYPSIKWTTNGPCAVPPNSEAKSFLDLCTTFHFTQMVTQPTRCCGNSVNTLDLVLTTCPEAVTSLSVLPGLSDHSLLQFDLNCSTPRHPKTVKQIRDYSRADYASINTELSTFVDDFIDNFSTRSLEVNWGLFRDKVADLSNKYIPLRSIKTNRNPWFNKHLQRLANKKKRAFRHAKRSNHPEKWRIYQAANRSYLRTLREAKHTYNTQTLPDILKNKPRQFWKLVNGDKDDVITINSSDGVVLSNVQCASAFNDFFVTSFSKYQQAPNPSVDTLEYSNMPPLCIDPCGVAKIIDTLKLSSASGIDNINSKFLKNTKEYSSIILSKIFEQSLLTEALPSDWKVGKVVPVHKSSDKHKVNNYRPISLTSIPCKIMEHILSSEIARHLDSNTFFHNAQHGFRKTFSCETQLACFTNSLHSKIDHGSRVDCIFLDFAKAFDKVSHELLMLKLSRLNLDPNVLAWLRNFHLKRSQFVTVNQTTSSFSPVYSGVPQGSVLVRSNQSSILN